ncbi:MAG: orotate phosphoribosyltransferase [Bacteroidales bacterium]|nr:orotate phosphoribosyltransferase [Bacteroidales bacterium]
MKLNNETALKIAEHLLQIKAIKLEPAKPFTWASGWKSPIYCDNRKILSYPETRNFVRDSFVQTLKDVYGIPDVIAGVATGGIGHGVLVAQELGLPFCYVRSAEKAHGLENKIEGFVQAGQSVVVIEDLISTGQSSLRVVEALRSAGLVVKGMIAIFSYGFEVADMQFKDANCPLHTLSNYEFLINKALGIGYISSDDVNFLKEWRKDPANWGK